ncbi:uncharacterized protein SRS1_25042 [Sporisorium reilianum f. sp. reilianum]|uniref:DDE Tnp4 domain-containing protein n=1 Tax=Sporisorium reilianum f. sp. reilianum TaxID=72559 RepID=A0A2N8UMN1_9BASI|nr:uncharacterized protein SRS1_25042 [Sporisorium reilianum f. sp. reilianum]
MDGQNSISFLTTLACAVAIGFYLHIIPDSKTLSIACHSYHHFAAMSDKHFKDNFGLTKAELEQIHEALKLPTVIKTLDRDAEDSCTALLMLLGYLRGRSVCGLESQFGWSSARISRVCLTLNNLILKRWSHLLNVCNCRQSLLSKHNLQRYAQHISSKCGMDLVWGFVDGTLCPVARPTQGQEAVYNGWKHIHALKYQIISTPDGLIFVQGPWDGSKNDWSVWKKSNIQEWLSHSSFQEDGKHLYLFGNKGYHLDTHLIMPFKGNNMKPEETQFNIIMSKYHITVEWAIGSIGTLFPRLNNQQQQKFLLTPVAHDYLVAVIL